MLGVEFYSIGDLEGYMGALDITQGVVVEQSKEVLRKIRRHLASEVPKDERA